MPSFEKKGTRGKPVQTDAEFRKIINYDSDLYSLPNRQFSMDSGIFLPYRIILLFKMISLPAEIDFFVNISNKQMQCTFAAGI